MQELNTVPPPRPMAPLTPYLRIARNGLFFGGLGIELLTLPGIVPKLVGVLSITIGAFSIARVIKGMRREKLARPNRGEI
jgi:hypothetical protein